MNSGATEYGRPGDTLRHSIGENLGEYSYDTWGKIGRDVGSFYRAFDRVPPTSQSDEAQWDDLDMPNVATVNFSANPVRPSSRPSRPIPAVFDPIILLCLTSFPNCLLRKNKIAIVVFLTYEALLFSFMSI